jgi:hypothetical protein
MKPCEHSNGFWKTIYFSKWIFDFKKSVFVCTDCRDVYDRDYVEEFWKNKENAK